MCEFNKDHVSLTDGKFKHIEYVKSKPHVCPICDGRGFVSASFYISTNNTSLTNNNDTVKCRTCLGSGLVWG